MNFQKKIMAPIAIVALLLLVTVSYAMWYGELKINGNVQTGELDWEFVPNTVIQLDTCDFNVPDTNVPPGNNSEGKDVGCTDVQLVDTDGDGDYDALNITMHNVYPYYYEHIAFKVHNDGTIPLKIWRVIIDGREYYALNEHVLRTGVPLDLDGDGENDTMIWWGDNFGVQLHPCESADISLDITILQPAPENATLHMLIQFQAIAWNEYESALPTSP